MNFYSCYDLPRAEARIHEKKSNYLKAILENHQNRSTINRRRAADLPYLACHHFMPADVVCISKMSVYLVDRAGLALVSD